MKEREGENEEFGRWIGEARGGKGEAGAVVMGWAGEYGRGWARKRGIGERGAWELSEKVADRVWKYVGKFRGNSRASFFAWVGRICWNEAARLAEEEQKRPRVGTIWDAGGGIAIDPVDTATGVSSRCRRKEDEGRVRAAVEGLSPKLAEVVRMHYEGGMSFVEIGRELGITADAARMRHTQALKKLAARLEEGHGR